MSKKLEALENIKNYDTRVGLHQDDYDIIETALKDYENLQLKHKSLLDAVLDDFKRFKALEIIKEKRVVIDLLLKSENSEMYNVVFENWNRAERFKLTQKQFDLLKEVLS